MRELASRIRDNLDPLAGEFVGRLREIGDSAGLPEQVNLETARSFLNLIAASLEAGNSDLFALGLTVEQIAQGWPANSLQEALIALADLIEPMLTSIDAANFIRRVMVQAHVGLSEEQTQTTVQDDHVGQGPGRHMVAASQEPVQAVIDSMPFGVVIIGRDKTVRRANTAALATMGYESEGQLVGRICHDSLCPAEAGHCPILDLGQQVDRSERVLITRDGHRVPILKSVVPMTFDGEETLLEAFVDITESKQLARQVEESLERRGRQLQTTTEVTQEIAAAPALNELYLRVVTLIKERFGYYHAHLFLLNRQEDKLVTVAGYGEIGRQLVQQGHSIPMGRGVVGRTGAWGRPVLSPDVSQDPEWISHPLLPDTKGELAVPIVHGDRVLGVLDVQSDVTGALGEEDQLLLEGLSGQIAIAIESTRLRQETEENLRELEHLYQTMSREGWEAFQQEAGTTGYLFDQTDVVPTDDPWASEPEQMAERQAVLAQLSVRGETFGTLGVEDDPQNPLSPEELALVGSVAEQVAQALESARLLDEQQRARSLLSMRVGELDLLNDIGRKIDESPRIAELLDWVGENIPPAMQYPDLCQAAIEFGGNTFGAGEATRLPCQIVQSLNIEGKHAGRVTIAYTEDRDFLNEESALLGDVARRVSGYIENRRLFQQAQDFAEEQATLRRVTETVSRTLEMEDLLDRAMEEALIALDYDAGLISLHDPDMGGLYLATHRGLPEPLAQKLRQEGLADTLCEFVFEVGDTIVIADVREEAPVDVTGVIQQGLLAYSGTILPYLDETIGTICFFHRTVREMSDREVALMEAISGQIGVGIANSRLYLETQEALAKVEAVQRSYVRQGWQDHLRQRETLRRGGLLFDRDQTEQSRDTVQITGLWRPEMDQALQQGRPATARLDEGSEERTGLAVPITLRGQVLGVLGVESPDGDHQWTEDDMALIEAVSDQLGQTLESARLFADTQRQAERERLIGEITSKIRASANVQDILETTAVELAQALGTSRAMVRLGLEEPERQDLSGPGADVGQEVGNE
jgi:PAS domain S-box-containing protein